MEDGNGMQATLLRHDEDVEEGDLKGRIWDESRRIWRVALPSVISRICTFGTIVVTQSFIGHISNIDLAGFALVQTLSVRFVNGILLGMSSATETLCGQAFGAGQHHMMGIYLQRSWIVDLITLTVLLPIFIFSTQIFKLLGQDEAVANSGGYISLWFIPFVYNYVFSLTLQMYLQAQLKNMIIAWLSIFRFGFHILLSFLLVYTLNLGVAGAMIALSVSSWFLVFGEFVYVFGGWCPNSWKGFTVAAFKDLVPVVKLSISSGVMLCLELWYYAVLVLLAGYMEDAEVAISAFSISLNIYAWEFMICIGLLGAACIYPVLSGVAIGAGMQGSVAIVNLICFYVIGIPIGALLGYLTDLQVKGIWMGMIGGVVTETIALMYMAWTTDWDKQVKKASERLNRFYVKTSEDPE
ncbi:putative multi antimicrobial extrusion protein [Helianthus annuus]|nr:putative multi antimicrobial extrusion protein [Helianthus annuus]KAJ0565406.1 putative multi antimicrobial extrusion protein [Helianthus annuus]KAJ0572403.1 putative multi antimicrobial extrusion protein [Helianthus annuus]